MNSAYFRPKNLEEALDLLKLPTARLLGGGTVINQIRDKKFSIIDLQLLGLDKIHKSGNYIEVGSTVTLQSLLESNHSPRGLITAIHHEAALNRRNMATIGGSIISCDGRSSLLTALLSLDPIVILAPGDEKIRLGDLLPFRNDLIKGKLITKIQFTQPIKLAYEFVARTPMDKPIICVALANWSSGRNRLVLGGWGTIPTLAFDGNISSSTGDTSLVIAARNASYNSSDEWASSEYRSAVVPILINRCLN